MEFDNPNLDSDDHMLSPILPNFLQTIPRLNCLKITSSSRFDWNTLIFTLKSAFLHLMHLPTTSHMDLSFIRNFTLPSLTPSVNLHRLDMFYMRDGSPEIGQLEMMPKIREFHTSESDLLTAKLLHAKKARWTTSFQLHGS